MHILSRQLKKEHFFCGFPEGVCIRILQGVLMGSETLLFFTSSLREAEKKSFLMVLPLRPYPPSTLELNGRRTSFYSYKKVLKSSLFSLMVGPFSSPSFLRLPFSRFYIKKVFENFLIDILCFLGILNKYQKLKIFSLSL